MKLTREWDCKGRHSGNIGRVNVSQVGCTATTTKEELTFAISGHKVTFTGAMLKHHSARVNTLETKILSNLVECIKKRGN